MRCNKRRLYQFLFYSLIKAFIECIAPCGLLAVKIDSSRFCRCNSFLIGFNCHIINTYIFFDSFRHGHSLPARCKIDLFPLPFDFIGSKDLFCRTGEDVLKDIHHGIHITICFIKLYRGKLRIMFRIHSLVAEDTSDFVDSFNSAYDQSFQVKLCRNTKIHIHIQRIVMCNERTCSSTTGYEVQYRSFHFHISSAIQISTQIADKLGPNLEISTAFIRHNEINIALTIFEFHIGHSMEFLRQRSQRFTEKNYFRYMYRNLLGFRFKYITSHADDIADIIFTEIFELLLRNRIDADI